MYLLVRFRYFSALLGSLGYLYVLLGTFGVLLGTFMHRYSANQVSGKLVLTAHSRIALSPLAKETVLGKLTMEGGGEGALGTSPGENIFECLSILCLKDMMIHPILRWLLSYHLRKTGKNNNKLLERGICLNIFPSVL